MCILKALAPFCCISRRRHRLSIVDIPPISVDVPLPVQPRLPIEVCEYIIEDLFETGYSLVQTSLATLASCALVCRAWRPRAQQVLFAYVLLRDKQSLDRFAALLDASPQLGSYVQTLALRGYLHVPYSPAVLFVTVLRGKLSHLRWLSIDELSDGEKAAKPLSGGEKELPSLPIHRYFPSLLASFSHIRTLDLTDVRVPSFGDFARSLNTLANLEKLYCEHVSCAVLGQEPPCMARSDPDDLRSRTTFLCNLQTLVVC